jgi:carboxylesterase
MVNPEIPDDRHPYQLNTGRVGALMLHGFMGSPKSSRPMAEYLHARGITVHCPLLPGHGHLPARLHKVSHRAWLDTAETAYQELRATCDELFLIGHSMGAVLSAMLATRHRDIRGIVMLAPLYAVPRRSIHAMAVVRYVVPWLYPLRMGLVDKHVIEERVLDFDPTLDLNDPDVQAWLNEGTRLPTSALDEMRKMARLGRKTWPRITQPVLVFQGEQDEAVDPQLARTLFDMIPVEQKTLRMLPKAGHEMMRLFDPTHEVVWDAIFDFCLHNSKQLQSSQPTR